MLTAPLLPPACGRPHFHAHRQARTSHREDREGACMCGPTRARHTLHFLMTDKTSEGKYLISLIEDVSPLGHRQHILVIWATGTLISTSGVYPETTSLPRPWKVKDNGAVTTIFLQLWTNWSGKPYCCAFSFMTVWVGQVRAITRYCKLWATAHCSIS